MSGAVAVSAMLAPDGEVMSCVADVGLVESEVDADWLDQCGSLFGHGSVAILDANLSPSALVSRK